MTQLSCLFLPLFGFAGDRGQRRQQQAPLLHDPVSVQTIDISRGGAPVCPINQCFNVFTFHHTSLLSVLCLLSHTLFCFNLFWCFCLLPTDCWNGLETYLSGYLEDDTSSVSIFINLTSRPYPSLCVKVSVHFLTSELTTPFLCATKSFTMNVIKERLSNLLRPLLLKL